MVRYIYDAWGNHKVVDNNGNEITDTAHIGNINPYRYRGYYFDTETGLYYLKSRYYDPETGRFISLDDISFADPDTINGLNLYAYCCNNPVMHIDPNGTIPFANSVLETYLRTIKIGFDNKYWGRINYSTIIRGSTSEKGVFYLVSPADMENSKIFYGAGINVFNWFGIELTGDEEGNYTRQINITPWVSFSRSVGLSGITYSVSINIGETSHEVSVGIGNALAVVVIGALSLIYSGGQTSSTVLGWFKAIFS